jgi:hypothetical protein
MAWRTKGRSLVERSQCYRALFTVCVRIFSAIWSKLNPLLTASMTALALLAWQTFWICLTFVGAQLTEHGYSWKPPFKLARDASTGLWQSLVGCYICIRLMIWIHVWIPCPCKGKTPFEVSSDLARNYEQRNALQDLALMSLWDMANVIMERDSLKVEIEHLESTIRDRIVKDIEGTTKALGGRAISWRTSHEEMCHDYSKPRRTNFMQDTY